MWLVWKHAREGWFSLEMCSDPTDLGEKAKINTAGGAPTAVSVPLAVSGQRHGPSDTSKLMFGGAQSGNPAHKIRKTHLLSLSKLQQEDREKRINV